MVSIRQHRLRWKATVRVPKALTAEYGASHLYRNLTATDRRGAQLEAETWENALRLKWAEQEGRAAPSKATMRAIYEEVRQLGEGGSFVAYTDLTEEADPVQAGIEMELWRMADADPDPEADLDDATDARVAGLQDALRTLRGQKLPRRVELEATFRELADDYLKLWKAQHGLKETNTEQQKVATFDLFGGYWGDRPIREVRKKDVAAFVDALRTMDPLWARSAKARKMTWAQLQRQFGGKPTGLSDATINRHMATLQSYWKWAQERDHCEGNNPFSGFHRKLKAGRNVQGYLAWSPEELTSLFNPPPKRTDLSEIMLVAMFSGMRLDEIASLTRGRIKTDGDVTYLHIADAKTEAGVRNVPLHPRLQWLAQRADGPAEERIWPGFNEEGPGKKAGADAGKEFSRFKLSRGFTDRRRVFHSFRKNFVGQLEEQGVPQSEVAQLVGHEKGFTFGTYGTRLSLKRLAAIVGLIDYPKLSLPEPSAAMVKESA